MTSILSWYAIDDALESINDSLELILLEEADLSLMMSISMFISIVDGKQAICKDCMVVVEVENNVFTNSLMGTTIQDGGKKERSNDTNLNSKFQIRK